MKRDETNWTTNIYFVVILNWIWAFRNLPNQNKWAQLIHVHGVYLYVYAFLEMK